MDMSGRDSPGTEASFPWWICVFSVPTAGYQLYRCYDLTVAALLATIAATLYCLKKLSDTYR